MTNAVVPKERLTRATTTRDRALAAGCGFTAFLVYALTAAPTVTGEDAGELASAAWTLGVPHPPGYPLYVLLGKAAMVLVPFGDRAYRLNLFSGLMGGFAIALLFLLSRRLRASSTASFAAALLAAFTPTFWSQATIAEVYTLSSVVLLLAVHVALSWIVEPQGVFLVTLAYLFGLGLTAHPTVVLLAPGLAVAVALRSPRTLKDLRVMAPAGAFFLLGFSLYLYLPIRSLADPAMDWGNPESLSGFLAHVLRRQYAGLVSPPKNPVLDRLLYLGHVVLFELGPLLFLLGAAGARGIGSLSWIRRRPAELRRASLSLRWAYAAWILAFSVGLLFILTVSFQRQTLEVNRVFFIPLVLLSAVPAAFGLDRVALFLAAKRPAFARPHLRWASLLFAPAVLLFLNWSSQDLSRYTIGRDYAEAVLRTLPEGAVYIPTGDHATFPVLYLQDVEGLRPDVFVADKYGYLDPGFLRRIGAGEKELAWLRKAPRAEAERWLIDRAGRPVFVNSKHSILEIPTERFQNVGLLYRVDRERAPLPPEEETRLWNSYRFGNLDRDFNWHGAPLDGAAVCFVSEILTHRAECFYARKRKKKARSFLIRIADVAEEYREILQNTGSLFAEWGMNDRAAFFYRKALSVDPDYAQCRRNYARLLLVQGRNPQAALEIAEKSLRELPPDPEFLMSLARVYRACGRYGAALSALADASRLDPGNPLPPRLSGEITEHDLGLADRAKSFYRESLRRKPTQADLIEKVYGRAERLATSRRRPEPWNQ